MASLAELRAKLEQDKPKERFPVDPSYYAYFNGPDKSTATLRFLCKPSDVYFWVRRLMVRLPFQGEKGKHENEVFVPIPCMEMYGKKCPTQEGIKHLWGTERDDEAKKRYKKASFITQFFVVNSSFEEKELPNNSIRKGIFGNQIMKPIIASLMNPDMEDNPTDPILGRDYNLRKTLQGPYANYNSSSWSFKTRSWNNKEQDAVSTYGYHDLEDSLPKEPTVEELRVIIEMFEASMDDQSYDSERWGNYFRPYATREGNGQTNGHTAPNVESRPIAAKPLEKMPDEKTAHAMELLQKVKAKTLAQNAN